MISTDRHKEIIKFLKNLDPNQYSGLEMNKKELFAEDIDKGDCLTTKNITLAVVALTDILNIHSGSAGTHDLYRLLGVYLTDKEMRLKINTLIK